MLRSYGPAPARVMIVLDFPTETDAKAGMPLSGPAGREYGKILAEAGLQLSECFVTSALRIRPPGSDVGNFIALKKKSITPQHGLIRDRYCLPPVWEGLELLKREIELVQPNVIIALGNMALWALTGKWGITSWRGSMLKTDLGLALDYQPQVLPAYSPTMILRQWTWRPITVHDLRRAKRMSAHRSIIPPDYSKIIRPNYGQALAALQLLARQADKGPLPLSVDIETRGGHIACIGFAWSSTQALCIPLMCVERAEGYWTLEEETTLLWNLHRLLTHPNAQVIGQNFLYDAQYFYRWLGYMPRLQWDTMLAQHSMFSNMPKSLDYLASLYCDYYCYWKDDGKTWDEKTGEDQLWDYNCDDALYTMEIAQGQKSAVQTLRLGEVNDFQQKLFWPVVQAMNRGVRIDRPKREKYAQTLLPEIMNRQNWLNQVIGREFNASSPVQMQNLFYRELGMPEQFDRKSGSVTCNDEALGKLLVREPGLGPLVRTIQELRSLGVFFSTFVQAPLDTDGRMRCSFNIGGTDTYRFSSSANAFGSGMNMQNIPKGGEVGDLSLPNIRELFIPDDGCTFFDIDLSSADLRIVVWEADEPEFKAMLKAGLDPYTEIAKEFYHDPSITKKDPRRQTFKSFAHGTNYLGTAKGLAERLGLGVHEAEQTQRWYFGRFPKIKRWQEDLKDQVVKRRMVQNIFGYRMHFFDRIEFNTFNEAAAWIPQSTVACLINRAFTNIYNQHKDIEVLIQVHDSLAGQFPTRLGQDAIDRIVRAAEIPLPYAGDPLIIPVGVKTSEKSWGDCD